MPVPPAYFEGRNQHIGFGAVDDVPEFVGDLLDAVADGVAMQTQLLGGCGRTAVAGQIDPQRLAQLGGTDGVDGQRTEGVSDEDRQVTDVLGQQGDRSDLVEGDDFRRCRIGRSSQCP